MFSNNPNVLHKIFCFQLDSVESNEYVPEKVYGRHEKWRYRDNEQTVDHHTEVQCGEVHHEENRYYRTVRYDTDDQPTDRVSEKPTSFVEYLYLVLFFLLRFTFSWSSSATRKRILSTLRPKRFVMVRSNSPTPDIIVTGVIHACSVLIRIVSGSIL